MLNGRELFMGGEKPTKVYTEEERQRVGNVMHARFPELAGELPDYSIASRDKMHEYIDAVADVCLRYTSADPAEVEGAKEYGVNFTDFTYQNYEDPDGWQGGPVASAFVVPLRASRHSNRFANDSYAFYPSLSPERFPIPASVRMPILYRSPPAVIETIPGGVIAFAPLYEDMQHDLARYEDGAPEKKRLLIAGAEAMKATAIFTHQRLGASVVGLGATIPKVTNFGDTLKYFSPGMETTTGHGGTVHLIVETIRKIREETPIDSQGKIGMIGGAGSIGWATTETLFAKMPSHTIYSNEKGDRALERLRSKINSVEPESKISLVEDVLQLLKETNIIVSATTTPIDLDTLDPHMQLDLRGKVIIDDSQPPCFDKAQVEARGGSVVWVVGQDNSQDKSMTRQGLFTGGVPYDYGRDDGLYEADFGCALEAATVAKAGVENAVKGRVTVQDVNRIGKLFEEFNVGVGPFQSHGEPVNLGQKMAA